MKNIIDNLSNPEASFEAAEERLNDNLEKGLIDEEIFTNASETLDLIKGGKRAVIGEIRKFGGRDYIKTVSGWTFHGKGTGKKAQDNKKSATVADDEEEGSPIENHNKTKEGEDKKKDSSINKTTLTKQESSIAFDWRDDDDGIEQFNTALEKLGAHIHNDGDNIYISTERPISQEFIDKANSDDGVSGEDIAEEGLHWIQPGNEDTDEIVDQYKTMFKELGHTVKEDSKFEGTDTYVFKIQPIKSKKDK